MWDRALAFAGSKANPKCGAPTIYYFNFIFILPGYWKDIMKSKQNVYSVE